MTSRQKCKQTLTMSFLKTYFHKLQKSDNNCWKWPAFLFKKHDTIFQAFYHVFKNHPECTEFPAESFERWLLVHFRVQYGVLHDSWKCCVAAKQSYDLYLNNYYSKYISYESKWDQEVWYLFLMNWWSFDFITDEFQNLLILPPPNTCTVSGHQYGHHDSHQWQWPINKK